MAALTRGLWLLRSAVTYALGAAGLASPGLQARPTPCEGWDLRLLLRHVADSMDVLSEAMTAGSVGLGLTPGDEPAPGDPVMMLRDRACTLLAACAGAGPDERLVIVGNRGMPVSMTALTGALEITVHGWDIAVACGSRQPVPPLLAAVLLPVAPLLVTPAARSGLFSDPVPVPSRSGAGDQLVAFLGREPRPPRPAPARQPASARQIPGCAAIPAGGPGLPLIDRRSGDRGNRPLARPAPPEPGRASSDSESPSSPLP